MARRNYPKQVGRFKNGVFDLRIIDDGTHYIVEEGYPDALDQTNWRKLREISKKLHPGHNSQASYWIRALCDVMVKEGINE